MQWLGRCGIIQKLMRALRQMAGNARVLVARCNGSYGSDWPDLISEMRSDAPTGQIRVALVKDLRVNLSELC
jgi:hypothetical protein